MRLFLFPIMCLLVVVFSSGTAVAENSGFSVNGYGVVIDAPSGTLLARQIIAGVVTVSYDTDVDNNTRNTIRDTLQQIRDRGMVVEAAWSIVADPQTDPQEIARIANDAAAAFNQTYVTTWLRYDGQSRRLLGPYPGVTFILQRDPSVCIAEIYMPAERVGGNSEATCGYWYHQLKDGAIFEEESMVLHRTDISDSWFSNPNTVSMLTLFNHYNDLGRSGTERMVIPGMVVVPPGTGSTPVVSWDAQAQAWSLPSNAKIRFLAGSDGRQEVVCTGYPLGDSNRKVVRYAGRSFVQQGTLRAEGPTSIPPEAYRVIDNHETGDCGYVRVKVRLNNNQEEVRYIPDTISGFVWQGRRDPFRSWRRIYTAEEVGVEDGLPGQRMIVGYFTRTRHEGKISFRVSESEAIRYDSLPGWAKAIEDSRQGVLDLVESLQQMQDQAARSHLKVYTDTTAPERSPTTTRLFLKSMRAMNVERDRRDQDWIGLQTSMSGESTVSFTPSAATPQGYSSGPSAPLATTMSSFHKTYATSQELQRAQEAFNAMRNAIQQDQKALAEQVLLATPQSQDVEKPATRPDYGTWAPGMPTARPRPRRTMSLDEAMRITANRVAQEAEGGQKITANLQDFKKAFIKPAGLLPQDITPPWSTTENVDTTSPDFLGGGDGDNPWIGRPEIVWRTFGLPFYDHDGDGDLDRYGSSDPFDSGYTHLRIRWHLLPETFFIRTGITAGLKSWATQMGFTKKFRPVDDMDKLGHQACFSVAGLRVRRDGSIKSQDILFWGNDTTFTFKRQEKKKKAGVTVSRKWFYGPSLENMLVRAAPGTSQQDPDSHNTWIFRLLYAGEATNSEAVRSPEVEPLRSIPAVQQTWYKTRENNIEGETTEATHPHIVYIHSGLPYKLRTITESAIMNPELPIEEDTSTYAEEGVGIAANFVPLSTSNPPKMLVDGTQRAVATTYTRIIEYYDATGKVERRETKKYYYPGTALRYTIYVYDAGSEKRTEVVEEIVIDVINRTQSEINNDANADADDTEAPAENKGQWVNAATGQPVPANDFQSQWLASKGWSAPRYATTITVFRGEVQTLEAARSPQQEKIGTYRYDRVQTDVEEQQRQNPVIEQGDELWVWGVNGVLNRDLNGDGQINHLDDGVLLSRLQAASGASNNAVVMSQIAELVEKFTRYYQAGNNPVIFAQEAISMLQTSENAAVAAGVLIAVGPLYLLEQIVYVWISNVIVRFEQTLWDQAPEAMAVLYAVATVAAFFGAPLAIAFLAFMAQMYLYKYVIGPVISLFTTILFSAFNKANPLKPLQEKDPEGWNRLPWFVKRQTVYGPGAVQLNPNRDAIPGSIKSAIGIDGAYPIVTTTGSALRSESSGIIEFLVRSNMNLYRTGQQEGWRMFLGQPMATTYYFDGQRFVSTNGHPTNAHAEIDVGSGKNLRGDRIYELDAGMGVYVVRGQVRRFFNEWQQARLLREMWAYDFMTPPSRKLVQLWNNQDPNSPLLKDAWPTRISVQPIQSGTGNNTSGSNHRDISALISAKWGGADGGRRHRRTVEDVARDAPNNSPLKAQIGNSLDTTKRMYIDDIVARRLQLRRQPVVFIFSAFRGREWEKEMAKRMPAGTLLWCVEWEDREAVRQEFTDAGLAVTFLEARSRVDRGLQSESLRTHNVGGKEGSWIEDRAYSWLGATYLGVSPWYRIKGDYGRDIAVYSAEDTIVASIRQIYEQLKNAAQPPQKAQEAWAAFGVSPYLVFDVSGRPAFYVSRMGNTEAKIYGNRFLEGNNPIPSDFFAGSNLSTFTKVWNQNRLLQILITDPTSNSFGPVLLETSSSLAVPADIIEIRHPMLVYYNDETSATYVHYGLRCNPKDIFAPGKWEQHTGTPPNVTMNNDQEAARRRTFEGMFAYNADFIRNVHAIIRRQQHNEYLAFLNMRPPPPVEDPSSPKDPGSRPIEPQEPQRPNISLPVPPTRRVVHVHQMPPLRLPRWKRNPCSSRDFLNAYFNYNPDFDPSREELLMKLFFACYNTTPFGPFENEEDYVIVSPPENLTTQNMRDFILNDGVSSYDSNLQVDLIWHYLVQSGHSDYVGKLPSEQEQSWGPVDAGYDMDMLCHMAACHWYKQIEEARTNAILAWLSQKAAYEQARQQEELQAEQEYNTAYQQYLQDCDSYNSAILQYQEALNRYNAEQATYPTRLAEWQAKKSAYDAYENERRAYEAARAGAESYLIEKNYWVEAISSEARLPGVTWANSSNQPVPTSVTNFDEMPNNLPIWMVYRWVYDPDYYPPENGAKTREFIQGLFIPRSWPSVPTNSTGGTASQNSQNSAPNQNSSNSTNEK